MHSIKSYYPHAETWTFVTFNATTLVNVRCLITRHKKETFTETYRKYIVPMYIPYSIFTRIYFKKAKRIQITFLRVYITPFFMMDNNIKSILLTPVNSASKFYHRCSFTHLFNKTHRFIVIVLICNEKYTLMQTIQRTTRQRLILYRSMKVLATY